MAARGVYFDEYVPGSLALPFGTSFPTIVPVKAMGRGVITLSPVAVVANTTTEQTFTITGLAVGDIVELIKPTTQAGLGIVNTRVSAANTLAVAFLNATAASITPTAAEVYQFFVVR